MTLILSWILLLISYIFAKRVFLTRDNRNSSIVISILYLLSFVPFTTCVYAKIFEDEYILFNCIYWFFLLYGEIVSLSVPVKRLPRLYIGRVGIRDMFVWIAVWFSILLIVLVSGYYTHFRLNFNLFTVYDIRLEARNYHFPTIVSYLFSWTRAIIPVLLAYSLLKKNKAISIMLFLTQMLSFGIDGLKSAFFMPFIVIAIVSFPERISAQRFKYYLLSGLTAITFLSMLENVLFRSHFVSELIIRRVMFIPNYLSRCYYDFFRSHAPDYFRSSFLRFLGFHSPYTTDSRGITYMIGAFYFNRPTMNCNNGLVSDALTNLGKPGLVLMPILLVLVLRFFDRSSSHLDRRLSATTSLYLSYVILSTFLMTVLLTHGMLILIILLAMMNQDIMSESLKKVDREKRSAR